MGHYNKENLEKRLINFVKLIAWDRKLLFYRNKYMDSYYSILSYDGRNPDIINRGGEAARYCRQSWRQLNRKPKICVAKKIKDVALRLSLSFRIQEIRMVKELGK